ncbi:conserved hypothetical protein [Desulfamplus magnetovallimortis]|uniref:Histidine phosphatase family protein n=1 Tax=Desulfamplus magnetovallimortis TaxID=1246637 RepID=A0A1W1HHM6_9BACT|nr:histidine phosphatase family protein [Desulfamplus magnetovallimortis]SLM31925.1 conserved hypothetical protein [Desulfamplus magnetovallimortis]
MRPQEKIRDTETINTITGLLEQGVEKMSVIMRHSDRLFHKDSAMEPFMGLTEKGKDAAMQLGSSLPAPPRKPRFFSSTFGRCIETAYLIDKGFTKAHKIFNGHNVQAMELAPFYIINPPKAIAMVSETGNPVFLREWFDNKINESVMLNPEAAANRIAEFMTDQLKGLHSGEIAINVSHDWNLFPLKEFKLGLPHETFGMVGYLESVVIFERGGKAHMTSYQMAEKGLETVCL